MLSIILPHHSEPTIAAFVEEIQDKLPVTQIIVSRDRDGKGKGWAIRQALTHAKGEYVAFLDGDGDIPCRMLLRLLPFLEDFDVVVGSKRITHSPMRRKVMTHVTRLWFRFLYGVQVDTQTGIKLFKRSALELLGDGSWWESNGFIFDVEIIANLQKKGVKIVEVPIECEIRKQLAFKTIFKIAGESIWLKFRLLFPRKK